MKSAWDPRRLRTLEMKMEHGSLCTSCTTASTTESSAPTGSTAKSPKPSNADSYDSSKRSASRSPSNKTLPEPQSNGRVLFLSHQADSPRDDVCGFVAPPVGRR